MLNFDKENKITFEQLSFSLQDKLRKIVTKTEIKKIDDLLTIYENALNGVRFSFVNNLNDVQRPVNDGEVAILNGPALTLWVYSENKWIRIPKEDLYYRLNITQSPNQLITVTANNKKYTSSTILKYGDTWTATIESEDIYYRPGHLNKYSGVIVDDDEVYATTPATLIQDYYLNMLIGKKIDADYYGMRIPWDPNSVMPEEQIYGSIEPKMFDAINITKNSSGTYSSFIAFFGDGPTDAMWDRVSMYLIYNGQSHAILSNEDLDNFNITGDISNPASFTNQYFYELFKSLKGKKVQIYIHFDKDSFY